jgi:putative membrane protein
MSDFFDLLAGTVLLRPYVFAFLAVYLAAGAVHLGWRRTLVFLPLGYVLAWLSEFASIHVGFPYGDYFYLHDTMGKELWVFGVPFMDSLSYVFLSYCSYSTAVFILSPVTTRGGRFQVLETGAICRSWSTCVLGAFLFVLLDIVIDPVALQGYKWFLGQIYGYRVVGAYFGVPFSNFAGWLLVGFVMVFALQRTEGLAPLKTSAPSSLYHRFPELRLLGLVLYVSVLIFNLSVTVKIGDVHLAASSGLIIFFPALLVSLFTGYKAKNAPPRALADHLADFPMETVAEGSGSGERNEPPDRLGKPLGRNPDKSPEFLVK